MSSRIRQKVWISLMFGGKQLKDDFMGNLQKLPENVKKSIIATADNQLKAKWVTLTAMDYLDYKITGNRFYEAKTFDRNKRLQDFVLAELLVKNGKYLNEVMNGLWLTLEESTWAWPAHLSHAEGWGWTA